ncbi:MAG TPA: DNA polymerase I [Rectinema sp.]|nr:DNA polymerase I [Rectinema sp.]HQG14692.1 DNA polymerase I [Rectinema sp.]
MDNKSPLYILDVYAIIYRSYFAFIRKPLRNSKGENVSALFGFFRFLFSLFEQRKPELFAAALDSIGPTFRHTQFATYKATRQKTPEDLTAQIPRIETILQALEVPAIRSEGYEADDIIATLADQCRKEGRPCFIVSGDKDLLQLVGDDILALRPSENFTFRELDAQGVFDEWGVRPDQIRDFLALTGDASDNVPGVKGIGEKTAQKLISMFGSLEAIYDNLPAIEPESLRKKLEEGRESAFLSRELISLCYDVPNCPHDVAVLKPSLNIEAAAPLLLREDIKSLIPDELRKRLHAKPIAGEEVASAESLQRISGQVRVAPSTNSAISLLAGSPGAIQQASSMAPLESISGLSIGNPMQVKYEPVLSIERLDRIIDEAIARSVCAFDTETDSLDVHKAGLVGFSLAFDADSAWYVPLKSPDAKCIPKDLALSSLSRLMKEQNMLLVGHNLKFDINVLSTAGLEANLPCFDTMIAAWVLDAEAPSFSLSSVASRFLGISGLEYEDVVPKGLTFADVPLATATQYASEDSHFSFLLYQMLSKEIETQSLHNIFYNIEMPLLPILAEMERIGIRVDAEHLRAYGEELQIELSNIESQIFHLVGHEFNLASPKQLADVLFSERKLPVQKRTKTGFSTDTSVLEELAPLDPVPQLILRQRLLTKLKTTYIEPLAELAMAQGRIHTTFMQTGAATGRLSSRDPNLQNIPIREEEGRKIREAFIAEQGHLLISADYSQIELAVMAHLSKDPNLIKAFKEGVDIHKRTASFIFGISEDQVDAERRRIAKTINFGVIYGMSAFRLARDLGISNSLAKQFIDSYFSTYSGVADFIQKTIKEAQERGMTYTLFGRRRKILGINSKNKTEQQAAQRVAVNTPIQGTAADIVKIAMIRVHRRLKKEMPEVHMLLQVHDELVFEAPKAMVEGAMKLIKEEMEHAVLLDIPLRVSMESAASWGQMHL